MVVRWLLIGLLMGLAVPAWAEDDAFLVTRFEPTLSINEEPELCEAFRTAWLRVYRSYGELSENRLDLRAALPQAQHLTFPAERQYSHGNLAYTGLYDRSYAERIDFDGDGKTEVLFVEAYQIGWRYLGAHLYVIEDARFKELLSGIEAADLSPPRNLVHYSQTIEGIPEPLLRLRPGPAVIHVLSVGGQWFATASPHARQLGGFRNGVDLIELNATGGPRVACRVDLMPDPETLSPLIHSSRYVQALYAIYGGPEPGCMGTMGWTAEPLEDYLLTMAHRPWQMEAARQGALVDPELDANDVAWNRSASQARETKYLGWGISDPISWRSYLAYRSGWPSFRNRIATHYRDEMKMPHDRARHLASLAYHFLADRTIYSPVFDYEFTGTTQRILMQAHGEAYIKLDELQLDESSTPREIAEGVAQLWLGHLAETATDTPADRVAISPEAWQRLLRALLYSESDDDLIDRVWNHAYRLHADVDGRANFANQLLIAALGNPVQMQTAILRGADVSAGTNWFGKTPLMYAAQLGWLNSARILLAAGAAVDTHTAANAICRHLTLERDHRTALMYAAENASPALIELLLEAGADPAAVDTQGNDALWYLSRNDKLGIAERGTLRQLVLSRR